MKPSLIIKCLLIVVTILLGTCESFGQNKDSTAQNNVATNAVQTPIPKTIKGAIAISTDAMQYILPVQPNINIEYIWNGMAIGFYAGLVYPDANMTVNPFASGQYTMPGTVYYGKAFKLYFKNYDIKRPKRYWSAQFECKPQWFNNVNFMDQPAGDESQVYYTMSNKTTVLGLDMLRGHEYGEQNILHIDFFYGIGVHDRISTSVITSSSRPFGIDGDGALGTYKGYIWYLTPVIGLKFGFNYLIKDKSANQ